MPSVVLSGGHELTAEELIWIDCNYEGDDSDGSYDAPATSFFQAKNLSTPNKSCIFAYKSGTHHEIISDDTKTTSGSYHSYFVNHPRSADSYICCPYFFSTKVIAEAANLTVKLYAISTFNVSASNLYLINMNMEFDIYENAQYPICTNLGGYKTDECLQIKNSYLKFITNGYSFYFAYCNMVSNDFIKNCVLEADGISGWYPNRLAKATDSVFFIRSDSIFSLRDVMAGTLINCYTNVQPAATNAKASLNVDTSLFVNESNYKIETSEGTRDDIGIYAGEYFLLNKKYFFKYQSNEQGSDYGDSYIILNSDGELEFVNPEESFGIAADIPINKELFEALEAFLENEPTLSLQLVAWTAEQGYSNKEIANVLLPLKMIKQKQDIDCLNWQMLTNITVNVNKSAAAELFFFCSIDSGETWIAYQPDTDSWADVDIEDTSAVMELGMSLETFQSLVQERSKYLLSSNTLRFAIGINQGTVNSQVSLTNISLQFKKEGLWQAGIYNTDYTYAYGTDFIEVTLNKAGDYKINYKG